MVRALSERGGSMSENHPEYDPELDDPEDDNTGQGDDSDRIEGGDENE
jgi:hypothetical protein